MDLRLPITFVQVKQSRVRLPGDAIEGPPEEWDLREEDWLAFWKSRGKEKLEKGGKAAVDETFWLDLVLRNPLDVDVTLSGLTAVVEDAEGQAGPSDLVEVEAVDDITLNAKETRTIPIAVKCRRPSKLRLTHIKYDFLALLPVTESLAIRGRRLNATPHQRQNKTYAPDVYFNVEVEDASRRLQATFVDDRHLILAEGERKQMSFWLHNTGTQTINEVWMVGGREDELWVEVSDSDDPGKPSCVALEFGKAKILLGEPFSSSTEDLQSKNSLESRRPFRIPISDFHSSSGLAPGESVTIPMSVHATKLGEQDLCLLLTFREGSDEPFRSKRLVRHYDVRKILDFSISARPSLSPEYSYLFNVEMENMTSYTGVHINQLTTLSPIWSCQPLTAETIGTLSPRQVARATFGTRPLPDLDSITTSQQFISKQMRILLEGKPVDKTRPPGVSLHCSHLSKSTHTRSLNEAATRHFIHSSCRSSSTHATRSQHPYIPLDTQEYVFPLHNPYSTNLVVFWEIPSQDRWGHVFVPGLTLGASHAPLREIVQTMESAKIKRSMMASQVQHDFSQERCNVNVPFTIRNYSLTHRIRYILKLSNIATELSSSRESLPPRYVGKLTFRGELPPTESHTVQVKLQALTPGSYTLNGWRVETLVGELPDEASDSTSWRIRQRYEQGPPKIVGCVTIVDTSS
ncbi:hypothetical protein QCA50_001989 [Cerrena zonata]|uniref:Uncharacterized protein n=1 Tax=Cerrena zonata TaxID=2478898 RepID=A0AAW0GY90_9APHY